MPSPHRNRQKSISAHAGSRSHCSKRRNRNRSKTSSLNPSHLPLTCSLPTAFRSSGPRSGWSGITNSLINNQCHTHGPTYSYTSFPSARLSGTPSSRCRSPHWRRSRHSSTNSLLRDWTHRGIMSLWTGHWSCLSGYDPINSRGKNGYTYLSRTLRSHRRNGHGGQTYHFGKFGGSEVCGHCCGTHRCKTGSSPLHRGHGT